MVVTMMMRIMIVMMMMVVLMVMVDGDCVLFREVGCVCCFVCVSSRMVVLPVPFVLVRSSTAGGGGGGFGSGGDGGGSAIVFVVAAVVLVAVVVAAAVVPDSALHDLVIGYKPGSSILKSKNEKKWEKMRNKKTKIMYI